MRGESLRDESLRHGGLGQGSLRGESEEWLWRWRMAARKVGATRG